MKIIQNKKLFKRILFVLLCIIIISFCAPHSVNAGIASAVGGKLLEPTSDLFLGLTDGFYDIVHKVIYHQDTTLITMNLGTEIFEIILSVAVGIVAAVAIGAAVVFTGGAVVAALASIGVAAGSIGLGTVVMISLVGGAIAGVSLYNSDILPDIIKLPVYSISPEEIFSNDVLLFDVDFFNPKESQVLEDGTKMESTAEQLRSTISGWYSILRDIAVVALLSILVYIGIRIVISSTSSDKAKYKQLLMDWLVAICLLFIMQYIMSFANLAVGKITELLKETRYDSGMVAMIADKNGKMTNKLKEKGYQVENIEVEGTNYIKWKTNLIGIARLNAQMNRDKAATFAGYVIVFMILVLFTIYFIFTYLKRVLYMAFLTLIAPLVALTYPIDKMNDGKAQAFDMWFKEYIFNLLIQPLHLILYTVLVSSAFELASTNVIYSIVAIAFMIPAEKMMRKFFGFEKAHTPGLLAGPAGAAATMGMLNKVFGKGPKGMPKPGKAVGSKDEESSGAGTKPVRFNQSIDDSVNGMIGEPTTDNNGIDFVGVEKPTQSNNEPSGYDRYMSDELDGIVPENNTGKQLANEDYKNNSAEDKNTEDKDTTIPRNSNLNNGAKAEQLKTKNIKQQQKAKNKQKIAKPRNGIVSNAILGGKQSLRYYGNAFGKGVKNAAVSLPGTVARGAGNVAKGMAGMALAAPIAVAVGAASGDPVKAAQIMGTTMAGGYKYSKGLGSRIDASTPNDYLDLPGAEEINEDKYIKNFTNDIDNQVKLEKKFGKTEAKDIMNNVVPDYLRAGIDNIDDIIIGYTMENIENFENPGIINTGIINRGNNRIVIARDGVISTINTANNYVEKDTTKMKTKDRDEWVSTFANRYGKNENVKKDNADPKQLAEDTLSKLDMYYNLKNEKKK